ncbi:tyrosine-type recombinase/integrase [Taibaiella lutea]|uniref:Tyrosine-type recombinase/integrase n=1 Tax=Taibaiella lutea TaxID=2608001 RepID=A0A5M6CFC9_9BACT|nr:site-specific integrase [Taibaiella lutea]KAA5532622.1 tyrosine-type recombinase/integrase [Taibaiella lutea]
MIQLTNGCTCTELKIYPKNWKNKNASTAKDWYIYYTFHDPLFINKYPTGKPVQVKKGFNYFKNLKERQEAVQIVFEATKLKVKEKGYNPITDQFMKIEIEEIIDYEVHPDTPILDALTSALEKKKAELEPHTIADYKSMMLYFSKSIIELRYDTMAIKDIKRRHIRIALQNCNKSPDRTNKYRSLIQALFKELNQMETIETNPVNDIAILKTGPKNKRVTLTLSQRKEINEFLYKAHYPFWRYMQIFFHSGARSSELFNLKIQDVDLKNQTYLANIKKGGQNKIVEKVIKDIALPYWHELISKCKENDYLFSFGFTPGTQRANTDRINKLWKMLVKDNDKLGRPQADFYSLKHTHSTEVVDLINKHQAAEHNSHTTTKMVDTVYDVRAEARKAETVKELKNAFA